MSITLCDQRGPLREGYLWVICHKKVPVKLKKEVYKTVIRPTLTYDSQCWALNRAKQQSLHATEMKMGRWIRGKQEMPNQK